MRPLEKFGPYLKSHRAVVISYVFIVLLMAEVVVLAIQNRDLKDQINGGPIASKPIFLPGEKVPSFEVLLADSNLQRIDYSTQKSRFLLFILSTTCPHCENNLGAWNDLAAKCQTGDCSALGVSIDKHKATRDFYERKNIRFYLSTVADSTFSKYYRVAGVPVTMVIARDGTVEKTYLGELSPRQQEEIEEMLPASPTPN